MIDVDNVQFQFVAQGQQPEQRDAVRSAAHANGPGAGGHRPNGQAQVAQRHRGSSHFLLEN
jgi:hypothetical protein